MRGCFIVTIEPRWGGGGIKRCWDEFGSERCLFMLMSDEMVVAVQFDRACHSLSLLTGSNEGCSMRMVPGIEECLDCHIAMA